MTPRSIRKLTAYRALLCAIVQRAVEDYRTLEQAGLVKNGISLLSPNHKGVHFGLDATEIQHLVDFLATDSLDHLLEQLPINVRADGIRRVLGIKAQITNKREVNAI